MHLYSVADTAFAVHVPERIFDGLLEERYSPFAVSSVDPAFVLTVSLTDTLEDRIPDQLVRRFGDEDPYLWLYRSGEEYRIGFSCHPFAPSSIIEGNAAEGYRLYVDTSVSNEVRDCCLNNAMMFLFTLHASFNGSLVAHASVVSYRDRGYVFLGRSGTGKSTHSRLWLTHIPQTELLNDDNPVIHLVEGVPYVYGSPWSGKTSCYRNERVRLGGVVRLKQAPANRIHELSRLESLGSLMSSCSHVDWDPDSEEASMRTIGEVVAASRFWLLECLPDADAAIVCCRNVAEKE